MTIQYPSPITPCLVDILAVLDGLLASESITLLLISSRSVTTVDDRGFPRDRVLVGDGGGVGSGVTWETGDLGSSVVAQPESLDSTANNRAEDVGECGEGGERFVLVECFRSENNGTGESATDITSGVKDDGGRGKGSDDDEICRTTGYLSVKCFPETGDGDSHDPCTTGDTNKGIGRVNGSEDNNGQDGSSEEFVLTLRSAGMRHQTKRDAHEEDVSEDGTLGNEKREGTGRTEGAEDKGVDSGSQSGSRRASGCSGSDGGGNPKS